MIRIAHITDLHFEEAFPKEQGIDVHQNWERVLDDIKNQRIDQVICTGDIGDRKSISSFLSSLQDAGYMPKLALGNHDDFHELIKHNREILNQGSHELFYSYIENGFKYIFLDSSAEKLSTTQLNWLYSEIRVNEEIMLFIHHPILDCETVFDQEYPMENREEILEVLQSSNQQVNIYCGHYHMDDVRTDRNLRQHVTPAVSYQVVKRKDRVEIDRNTFGYRIIKVDNSKVESEVRRFQKY